MRRKQLKIVLLLVTLCFFAWGIAAYLLHERLVERVIVIPTLMVLPTVTPSVTPPVTALSTASPTVTATATVTPTSATLPTFTSAPLSDTNRLLSITAYMPGVYLPPTLTPLPPDVTIIPAPPNPFEPLPDATLGAPPFMGWYSFESDNPAVSYFPAWEPRLAEGASRGQYHRTESVGAVARFAFEGDGLRLRYVAAPNMGSFEVWVDGVRLARIDAYAETLSYPGTGVLFVGSGSHVLQIRCTGEHNPRSEGNVCGLDAVQVYRADPHTLILPLQPEPSPSSTPRPAARIELVSAPPTLAATNTPEPPAVIAVSLVIAYDENGNNAVDPAEGVRGIPARLVDATTNQVIADGFSDARGYVYLDIIHDAPTRLVVPYFGKTWDVSARGANTFTLLLDAANQPGLIP